MIGKLIEKWLSWQLQRDIESGRVLRGRQPDMAAKAEPKPVLSMRVFRAATQEWENVPIEET